MKTTTIVLSIYLIVLEYYALNSLRLFSSIKQSNHKLYSSSVDSSHISTSPYKITSENGVHKLAFETAGKSFSLETGKIGRQAGGAVVARTEDTMVYATACAERTPTSVDFAPLRVDFFARYSAVGQTIGAFHRRDSRGDDTEILVARLIDRPIRPMLHDGWQHETQLLSWVLSYDKKNSYEPLAICASSAALAISEVPFLKPVAGVEVGLIDGLVIVNPTKEQMKNSSLQLTIAGTKDGILMIEGFADFVKEEVFIEALQAGHKVIGEICDAISAFQSIAGSAKRVDTLRYLPDDLLDNMDKLFGDKILKALSIGDKHKRGYAVSQVENLITQEFSTMTYNTRASNKKLFDLSNIDEDDSAVADSNDTVDIISDAEEIPITDEDVQAEDEASELPKRIDIEHISKDKDLIVTKKSNLDANLYDPIDIKVAIKKLLVRVLRRMIQTTGNRSDGRKVDEVRPIDIETNFLPGAHGSTLFTRGETQAIATATLGSKAMEAKYETLDELAAKRFYLQYKFPPSSVGEVGRVGGISRREVGHGNLAERALIPSIPSSDIFPYSIRAESLITESCGSSSMATVCGCCLAMLDAGVPLTSMVAGVAMGLILGEKEGEEPLILTDILGLEDALGTMDFKVAGDAEGITTFQLDIKSEGLTIDIISKALQQARAGRLHVLDIMKKHLSEPRRVKDTVPKIITLTVPPESLGKIIGPKGKTIQSLIETYSLININIEDEGIVQIEAFSIDKIEEAKEAILKIVDESGKPSGGKRGSDKPPREDLGPPPEVGMIYRDCEVTGVHNFGVFVEVLPGHEGLVHISELDIKKIPDPAAAGIAVGSKIDVKCLGVNEKKQMRLSRRQVQLRDSGVNSTASGVLPSDIVISTEAIKTDQVTYPAPQEGQIFRNCLIDQVQNFGVFVNVLPGHRGLVHVSELDTKRITDPASAGFNVGVKIDVKCLGYNDKKQLRFSRKAVVLDDIESITKTKTLQSEKIEDKSTSNIIN